MTFFLLKFSICFQHYINNVFNIVFQILLYKCTILSLLFNKEYSLCYKHRLYSYYVKMVDNLLLQFRKCLLDAAYCFDDILVACSVAHSEAFRSAE